MKTSEVFRGVQVMQYLDVTQVQTQIFHLLEEAASGKEVVITKDNQPFVKLVPIIQSQPRPKFGSAKGLIEIADDFDEPLEEFRGYM
ncbi:type II toxin-antitoxin system prevent-host-death family antitoxin [Candidatus Marithioploca araucensis]|uniref:Type II toxin-antitoxin system prevent-host-death family antitoxin n=1 Tax=Candidatus Marithioploca araucensis TaxID=70273 RepID=A0ABT7VUF4_9GAMM|nr:type II toxin-antitoxin system prevent-host-death family antitoxin [Candidatus Marithioploca araucensis]